MTSPVTVLTGLGLAATLACALIAAASGACDRPRAGADTLALAAPTGLLVRY